MVGYHAWVLLSLHKKSPLRQIMKIHFDNVKHSSKYNKQDENPIKNQSLILLHFKCQAPALMRIYTSVDAHNWQVASFHRVLRRAQTTFVPSFVIKRHGTR